MPMMRTLRQSWDYLSRKWSFVGVVTRMSDANETRELYRKKCIGHKNWGQLDKKDNGPFLLSPLGRGETAEAILAL
jgi:hypothetical protein